VNEREREIEPAAHPTRVGADATIGRGFEAHLLEQVRFELPLARLVDPVQYGLQPQQLAAGHEWINGCVLKRDADRAAHVVGLLQHVEARDAGGARSWAEQGRQYPDGRRLPRPVRAQEPEDLARLHL
jgi:hypothetical protein